MLLFLSAAFLVTALVGNRTLRNLRDLLFSTLAWVTGTTTGSLPMPFQACEGSRDGVVVVVVLVRRSGGGASDADGRRTDW